MIVKSIYIWTDNQRRFNAQAAVEVPGIGEVKFDHALSDELIEAVCAQAEIALRSNFKLSIEQPAPTGNVGTVVFRTKVEI